MSHRQMRNSTVQTFYVLPASGPARPAQVFADDWRRNKCEHLAKMSPDFHIPRDTLNFHGSYRGADRTCWAADHRFDARPRNPRAQAMFTQSGGEVLRGDVIIEMKRRIWSTFWVSASVGEMKEIVHERGFDRVAICPEWRRRGGCYIAAPDDDERGLVIPILLLSVPDPSPKSVRR